MVNIGYSSKGLVAQDVIEAAHCYAWDELQEAAANCLHDFKVAYGHEYEWVSPLIVLNFVREVLWSYNYEPSPGHGKSIFPAPNTDTLAQELIAYACSRDVPEKSADHDTTVHIIGSNLSHWLKTTTEPEI